jgi:hemerythrin superfamily protein
MSGSGPDVIAELSNDHREFEALFQQLERPGGTDQERREAASRVIAALVRHSVAEEMYLYPTARAALPDGEELADREVREHAEAEQVMKDLEGRHPADPEFARLATRLIADVRHHIADEEGQLFPSLQQACTAEQLADLGDKVRAAKSVAPTRAHPSAPDRPPFNKLLAPGTGLVDRLRDALSGRPV